MKTVQYIDPSIPLADAAASALAEKVRTTPEGVLSFSHILVVVPTAESARSLSFALARSFKGRGFIAPRIEMQSVLVGPDAYKPSDGESPRTATRAEELAVLADIILDGGLEYMKASTARMAVDAAVALDEASSILGWNALDVHHVLAAAEAETSLAAFSDDAPRWREIAKVYSRAGERLAASGVMLRSSARNRVVAKGCEDGEIEEIVLPSAVHLSGAACNYLAASRQRITLLIHAHASDGAMFDEWGRPAAMFPSPLRDGDIYAYRDAAEESDAIARYFKRIDEAGKSCALIACDSETFPEIEGAFRNHYDAGDTAIANPAGEKFFRSPLGRLLSCLERFSRQRDYASFSAVVRSGDVARWAAKETGTSAAEVAAAVGELDRMQNAFLPATADDAMAALGAGGNAACALCRKISSLVADGARDPWVFLRKIFDAIPLDASNPAHRELAAAAAVARDVKAQCGSPVVSPRVREALSDALLEESSFTLEPSGRRILRTGGWIEAQWKDEDEIVFAGMCEGCIPESTCGHPLIPDSLRARLGLETNEMRAMRDSFLLREAAACRSVGAAKAFFHRLAPDSTVLKPSRIFFSGADDEKLCSMARRLYVDAAPAATNAPEGAVCDMAIPAAWPLALPKPPPAMAWRKHISVSELGRYIACPFDFYMHEIFGEHSDDRAKELDARHFGTLCHEALEAFANSPLKDSEDSRDIARFLRSEVLARQVSSSVINSLQTNAAIARLETFARMQAERRKAGWKIFHSELDAMCTLPGSPTIIRGRIDRIDVHSETGEIAVIDYKTWDKPKKNDNPVQLPAYRAMIGASGIFGKEHAEKARTASALYCVLAASAEDAGFCEVDAYAEGMQSDNEKMAVDALRRIALGIFWPPAKESYWSKNYSRLTGAIPEEGVDRLWIADQEARLAAYEDFLDNAAMPEMSRREPRDD